MSVATAADRNVEGEWSAIYNLPIVPSAGALLADGRVLLWSANGMNFFNGNSPRVETVVYDPASNTHEYRRDNIPHNMFCTGTTQLADGRLLTNGGNQSARTSIYDTATLKFTAQAEMNVWRGYNANTILQDGTVFTIGGSWSGGVGGKIAEILTVGGSWRRMSGIPTTSMEGPDRSSNNWVFDSHFWVLPAGNGKVFHAGPSARMHWIDTQGNGSVTSVGNRGDDNYSVAGLAVMYEQGKILKAGGASVYVGGTPTTNAYVIDINGDVEVNKISPTIYRRGYINGPVLPDGRVLLVGGQTTMREFSNDFAVLPAEMFDPRTRQFSLMAPIAVPRNYHAVALLLPDARVISAGGGLCGSCDANQPSLQIFSPPYLFDANGNPAARPRILSAPSNLEYGETITVTTDSDISSFSIVRFGAATHTINNDQRRLALTSRRVGENRYEVDIPSNPGWLLPGNWMLFAMNGDGVPSVASIVRVNLNRTVSIVSPDEVNGNVNVALTPVAVQTTNLGPNVTFSARGLPSGLSVNPSNGTIQGTPRAQGTFLASIVGTGPDQSISTEFVVRIGDAPPPPNRPPVLTAPATATGTVGVSLTVSPSATDPDGDTVTFSATGLPTGLAISASTGRITGRPERDGSFTTTVRARDPDGLEDTATINWTIAPPPNGTPVINVPDAQVHLRGATVSVAVSATDPDGDPITFSATGLPAGLTISASTGRITGQPTTLAENVLSTIRATDPRGAFDTGTIRWTIESNPPSISAPATRGIIVGRMVNVAVTASDPDDDAITFSAEGLPDGLSIDPVSGVISGRALVDGSARSTVRATDPSGKFASAAIDWTMEFGPFPTVADLPMVPVRAGVPVTYRPDIVNGEDVTYRWSFGDGTDETAFTPSADRTHTFAKPGVYALTIMMRMPDGRLTTHNVQQAVHDTVVAGVATLSSPGSVVTGAGASLRVWISNRDNDSVSVIDLSRRKLLREIKTGGSPEGMAVAPNGLVWVVHRDDATIAMIDPATLAVVKTVTLPRRSRPFDLVFRNDGRAVVSLEALRAVAIVSAAGTFEKMVPVGAPVRNLAYDKPRNRVLASRFVSPPVPGESTAKVDLTKGAGLVYTFSASNKVTGAIRLAYDRSPDSEASGRGLPNYIGAVAIAPNGKTGWVPSKKDNIGRGKLRDGMNLDFQNSVRAIVSKIDLATGREVPGGRIDLDNASLARAAVFHPTGAYMFVALETSRQVAVVDPFNNREVFRFRVGLAPTALTMVPDGKTLLVHNMMDRSMSVIDLSPLVERGQNAVTAVDTIRTIVRETLASKVLRGKQLFYDAADPRLARDGYMSCAACHDNAEGDGRTWDFTGFGEGLRNTPSLLGRGGMRHGFLHWSANFDEVQDFEGQIRGFAGGTGLMDDALFFAGSRRQPLGDKKAGLSPDLDALAAYLSSLTATPPSPFTQPNGKMTRNQVAGRTIFRQEGCGTCHEAPRFTISGDGSRLRNIGTLDPAAGKRLSGPLKGIDVPTLRGVALTAPYFHDGSASSLAQAIDRHKGVNLTKREMGRLVQYLKGL